MSKYKTKIYLKYNKNIQNYARSKQGKKGKIRQNVQNFTIYKIVQGQKSKARNGEYTYKSVSIHHKMPKKA